MIVAWKASSEILGAPGSWVVVRYADLLKTDALMFWGRTLWNSRG